jgi:hypothetical protein
MERENPHLRVAMPSWPALTAGRERWHALLVGLASVALAVELGFNYAVSNQNTYLLEGLRLHDPSLLANDWLVSSCTSFHTPFSYLASWLYGLDPSGHIFAFANVLAVSLFGVAVYFLVRQWSSSRLVLPVFLMLMAFAYAQKTMDLSDSYIVSGIFQPSTLGAIGLLGAMVFYLRGAYALSGAVLAVGGIGHVDYLVLGILTFGLSHLLLGRRGLVMRGLKQLTIPALAMLPFLPLMLDAAFSSNAAFARWIYQDFRAPHHYLPLTFLEAYLPFVGWHGLALFLGWDTFIRRENRRFLTAYLALLLLITASTLLTTVVFIPQVDQFYILRLAPYSVLLAQLVVFDGAGRLALGGAIWPSRRTRTIAVVIAAASVVLIYLYTSSTHRPLFRTTSWLFLVAVLAGRIASRRSVAVAKLERGVALVAGGLWLAAVLTTIGDYRTHSSLIEGVPTEDQGLFDWSRTTPVDSVFLVPPEMQTFRLLAERAIIVDWKSHPYVPDELVEWYHRLEAVSGTSHPTSREEVVEGYRNLTRTRLESIALEYPFDFAVVPSQRPADAWGGWKGVYRNDEWTVLQRP